MTARRQHSWPNSWILRPRESLDEVKEELEEEGELLEEALPLMSSSWLSTPSGNTRLIIPSAHITIPEQSSTVRCFVVSNLKFNAFL